MKMNVENKLDKVVNILKEKGFVVYRKGGKEPGVFYAKEGDSRIGFVYPNNGYIYDRIKMWSFSRVYKPHKKTGSSCLMCVSDEFTIENAIKNIEDRLWVNYIKDGNRKRPEEYKNINDMSNFVIGTPDNFWQIRWLDKYMEGHKGFIAGGCFKNILSGEKVKDIDIFFESESDFQEAIDLFNDEKHQKEGWKFKYRNEKACAFPKEGERVWIEFIESEFG